MDNHRNQTTNQTTANATKLLSQLANWVSETNEIADIDDQQEITQEVYQAFLCSSFADDNERRNGAIVIFNHFNQLYGFLQKYTHEDFQALDKLTLKMLEPCTTVTK